MISFTLLPQDTDSFRYFHNPAYFALARSRHFGEGPDLWESLQSINAMHLDERQLDELFDKYVGSEERELNLDHDRIITYSLEYAKKNPDDKLTYLKHIAYEYINRAFSSLTGTLISALHAPLPLHHYIENTKATAINEKEFLFLLKHTSVNQTRMDGQLPIELAHELGNTTAFKLLLAHYHAHKKDVDNLTTDQKTNIGKLAKLQGEVFHAAPRKGLLPLFHRAMRREKGPALVEKENEYDPTFMNWDADRSSLKSPRSKSVGPIRSRMSLISNK